MNSRHLDVKQLVNVAVKGPSSAGKTYVVEKASEFFPEDAYHFLTAMSERALAYSEEPLSHRFLILAEAAGMSGEFATYLVRSLLSEGRLRYETVEQTADGPKPRIIERLGPTGLIVTTTRTRLHSENETRMLTVQVDDTPDHTSEKFYEPQNLWLHRARRLYEWVYMAAPESEHVLKKPPPSFIQMRYTRTLRPALTTPVTR